MAEEGYILFQLRQPNLCQQLSHRLTLHSSNDFAFNKLGESFVDPKMFLNNRKIP